MSESQSPFRPSFLKIERAQRHIAEADSLVAEWLRSNPLSVTTRELGPDERPPRMIVGFRVELSLVRPMPETLSAVVGDVFHNLRSALDLMASSLARTNGQSDEGVYFPFAGDENGLDEMIAIRRFNRAGEVSVRLLKELKPYKGGNLELRAIHDLNVRDKHRELIVQSYSAATPIFDTRPEDGSLFKVVGDGMKPSSLQMVFPAGCALAGMELIPTLHKLVDTTARVIEAFEALHAPTWEVPVGRDQS